MNSNLNLTNKSFAVYGLGKTGLSVVKYLRKLKIKKFYTWDDNIKTKNNKKRTIDEFKKQLNIVDYVILSPGINIKVSKLKNTLLQNKQKIISDLDLWQMTHPLSKSIYVTGTNGKSTVCKIIAHILKKNKKEVSLGGNIGKPVLSLKSKKNSLFVIEASSFQLSYSKFIKPKYAIMLNVANDHLDWHGSKQNYINSKLNIFLNQDKKDFSLINNLSLIRKFKKRKFKSKLKKIKLSNYLKIKKKVKNNYLNSEANVQNMSFIYALVKILKISDVNFLTSVKSFKGLQHRQEEIYNKKNLKIINDSKATSFESTKFALSSHKNIFWIVGGKPKKNDIFSLKKFKKNIIKAYVVGKHINFFKKQLKNKIKFTVVKTIKAGLSEISKDINLYNYPKNTVLLSPASASYDQYKNFVSRGNEFKKLIKLYVKRKY